MPDLKTAYDQAIAQLTTSGAPFETVSLNLAGIDYTVYIQGPADLREVFAAGADIGNKEFLIYEGERWTFTQMMQQAGSLGNQLVNLYGIRKGDRVAIAMRNYPEWMNAFIAITCIGAVVVPLNSWGQARELEYALTDAQAKVVICDQQRLDLIADKLQEHNIQAILVRPDSADLPTNTVTLENLLDQAEDAAMPAADIEPDDLAMILYTSGTTGAPKGAVSTHRALCQSITNFECCAMAFAMINPEAIAGIMNGGHEPTQMLAVPLFHVSGLHVVFLTAFKTGRKVVMMYKWNAEQALQLIEQERITIFSGAPAMLLQLLESPLYDSTDTSSLISVGAGGAATPPRVSRLIQEKIAQSYAGTGWSLTETNTVGTSFTGKPFKNKPDSAGYIQPIAEISVRNEAGEELPAGEAGVLWIKSPALIKEYWNRPDANAKDFCEGWFNSSDIGYFDADGYLFLSGRAKDMVIRGGENIYPAEIEAVLHDHPAIEEVAVFGLPDEKLGEQVAAAVVTKAGSGVSEEDIRDFAAHNLARFKVPHYIYLRDEALPRNAAGKVLKNNLRAHYGG